MSKHRYGTSKEEYSAAFEGVSSTHRNHWTISFRLQRSTGSNGRCRGFRGSFGCLRFSRSAGPEALFSLGFFLLQKLLHQAQLLLKLRFSLISGRFLLRCLRPRRRCDRLALLHLSVPIIRITAFLVVLR